MIDIKKIDKELYYQRYIKKDYEGLNKLWNEVKSNKELLEEAIKVTKNKFGEDTLESLIICECMLITYDSVDNEVYQKLINTIYSNEKIARKVLDGAANGGYSFLLYTLFNQNLKLTEKQKAFAVAEAMNKKGTTRYKKLREAYKTELTKQGINDDQTVTIDFDGMKSPVGAHAFNTYMHGIMYGLSDRLAHGTGEYDIRYHILRNSNWKDEEKKKLIDEFWYNPNDYETYLDRWQWGIINDAYSKDIVLEIWYLYDYTYEDILKLSSNDKEKADNIWNEINFLRTIKELKMPSYLKDEIPVLKKKINN